MNRRSFLKWLFSMTAVLFSGNWLWRFLRHPFSEGTAPTNTGTSPVEAEATPAPSVAPQEPGKLLLSLFLLSDLHVTPDDDGSTAAKLKKALNDVTSANFKADAIVFGGDLTDFGRERDYKELRRILNGYKLPPLYANMGNHDYYDIWLNKDGQFSKETAPNGKTDAQSRERFQRFFGLAKEAYSDVWINGVHVILVSQEAYVQERPEVGEGAWYSDAQLAWLKETLKPHSDGRPALIMIHQPLPAAGTEGGSHRVIRNTEFREILKPYSNVFVFSGHTHRNLNEDGHYSQEPFHWFVNASVGRTRAPNGSKETPAQGMYIEVYEHQIKVRGREFSDRTWIAKADWTIPLG